MTTVTTTYYEKAKRLIQEKGWRQGPLIYRRDFRSVCLWEALVFVGAPMTPVDKEIESRGGEHKYAGMINWNDAPGRTEEEVYELLDMLDERYKDNLAYQTTMRVKGPKQWWQLWRK
jgi:hypothetical protein